MLFVRHCLPGERVRVRLTEARPAARFWRGDAVEVLQASPDRRATRCPAAGPGGCGGCDWQHASLDAQRRLKGEVVAEQLRRLGGLDLPPDRLVAEAVPGDVDGLRWRTRMRLAVGDDGRAGLRAHRSHQVVVLRDCPLAHPTLDLPDLLGRSWPPGADVLVSGGTDAPPTVAIVQGRTTSKVSGPSTRRERAAGRTWRVSGAGFWQVHPGAADGLVAAVLQGLDPRPGQMLLDLYSGVGLFAGSLAGATSPGGRVVAVESDADAVRDARRNLHDLPQVRLVRSRVDRFLADSDTPQRVDLVVADPPRSGAGAQVCRWVAARSPRAVAYVACDPAALARDLRTFGVLGYRLQRLRVLDLFPTTHHVECVATLTAAT